MKKTRAEEAENLLNSDNVLYEKDILAKKIEEIVDENAVEVCASWSLLFAFVRCTIRNKFVG